MSARITTRIFPETRETHFYESFSANNALALSNAEGVTGVASRMDRKENNLNDDGLIDAAQIAVA